MRARYAAVGLSSARHSAQIFLTLNSERPRNTRKARGIAHPPRSAGSRSVADVVGMAIGESEYDAQMDSAAVLLSGVLAKKFAGAFAPITMPRIPSF